MIITIMYKCISVLYLLLIIFAGDIQVLSDMSYWNLQATVNTSNLWNIPRILLDKHITCSSQADIRLSLTKMFQKLPTSGSKCQVCRKIKQNRNTLGRVWQSDLSDLLKSVTMQLHYFSVSTTVALRNYTCESLIKLSLHKTCTVQSEPRSHRGGFRGLPGV